MKPQDEAEERNGSKVTKIINPSQVKLESSNKSTMTTLVAASHRHSPLSCEHAETGGTNLRLMGIF
jgi:hypothetical protein